MPSHTRVAPQNPVFVLLCFLSDALQSDAEQDALQPPLRFYPTAAEKCQRAEDCFTDHTVDNKGQNGVENKHPPCHSPADPYRYCDDTKQTNLLDSVICDGAPALAQALPESHYAAGYPVVHLTDRRARQYTGNAHRLHQQHGNHDVDDRPADGNAAPLAEQTVCSEEGEAGVLTDVHITSKTE